MFLPPDRNYMPINHVSSSPEKAVAFIKGRNDQYEMHKIKGGRIGSLSPKQIQEAKKKNHFAYARIHGDQMDIKAEEKLLRKLKEQKSFVVISSSGKQKHFTGDVQLKELSSEERALLNEAISQLLEAISILKKKHEKEEGVPSREIRVFRDGRSGSNGTVQKSIDVFNQLLKKQLKELMLWQKEFVEQMDANREKKAKEKQKKHQELEDEIVRKKIRKDELSENHKKSERLNQEQIDTEINRLSQRSLTKQVISF